MVKSAYKIPLFFLAIIIAPSLNPTVVFADFVKAHKETASTLNLEWSSAPGIYEKVLKLRYRNPYFPRSMRNVSKKELAEAKSKDEIDLDFSIGRMSQIWDLIELENSEDFLRIRKEIDDLLYFCKGSGDKQLGIFEIVSDMRTAYIDEIKKNLESNNDKETLKLLEEANTFSSDVINLFGKPWIAEITRKDSAIDTQIILFYILSLDMEDLKHFVDNRSKFGFQSADKFELIILGLLQVLTEIQDNDSRRELVKIFDDQYYEKILYLTDLIK